MSFVKSLFVSCPSPLPLPPPQPPPLHDATVADNEEAPHYSISLPSEGAPLPFKPHLESLHRLIQLHRQESRHHRFLLRAVHRNHLRHKRRKLHSPQRSSFISRGRKCLRFIANTIKSATQQVLQAFTTIFNTAMHHIPTLSLPSIGPWIPPWRIHHLLHCNSSVFSFANADSDPGPARFDTDSIPIGADVCASATMSQHKHLFTNLQPVEGVFLKGVGGKIRVEAKGTLHLNLQDDKGETQLFQIHDSYLVPELELTLLCPQQWAKQREDEFGLEDGAQFITKGSFSRFQWDHNLHSITVPMDSSSNLPILTTQPSFLRSAMSLVCMPAVVSDAEDSDDEDDSDDATIRTTNSVANHFPFTPASTMKPVTVDDPILPSDQAEFLLLHQKMGHSSFHLLQAMSKHQLLPSKFARCRIPVCASCQAGKQHKRPWRTKASTPSPIGGRTITAPGDCVSVDQLKSSTPGLIGQVKGWLTRERHHTATVFVDHHSDLTFVHVTPSDTSEETVAAKEAFERFAASHDVTIKHYHADNGRFADTLFREHVKEKGQTISFCGVGAHHQNGKVEKRIRDIVEQARTMLLHASHRWPKAISAALWPYALHQAVNIRNNVTSNPDGIAPLAKFSNIDLRNKLFWKHQHPFGCPVFVLDAPLQGSIGGKPKWQDRSRLGVFLGHSKQHSSTVALVLNPKTGHVSPQFHVVFDDHFDTVKQGGKFESLWQDKADLEDHLSDTFNVETPHQRFKSPWFSEATDPEAIAGKPTPPSARTTADANTPEDAPTLQEPLRTQQSSATMSESNNTDSPSSPDQQQATPPTQPEEAADSPAASPSVPSPRSPGPDHPNRGSRRKRRRQPKRSSLGSQHLPHRRRSARLQSQAPHPLLVQAHFTRIGISTTTPDGTINSIHPLVHAFASTAATGDPDTMHLSEARKQPDWPKFREAMDKEVADFTKREHWELVPATIVDELKAKGVKFDVISAVWSFKRKRTPTGELIKHKSRLCAHGGQQTANTFWETFSPVVQWTTLRTILTLSIVKGWKARSIDFVLAYPQADIKSNLFMRIPFGFHVDTPGNWLLKLKKNVYGVKDAGRTWHLHLRKGLVERGFTASKVDPCVFTKGNLILVIYVDDVIAFCPSDDTIDEFISHMQKSKDCTNFFLEDQGQLKDYLGIEIVEKDDKIHITQTHLIDKIITSAGLDQDATNIVPTPATTILHKHPESEEIPANEVPFSYRSLIGQLNYLAATTRPDITFAVHQCAKFCNAPRKAHYTAVKRIVRYLRGTRKDGLILDIKRDLNMVQCFVDADFAGAWDKDNPDDPSNVKSRTGFIIKFANCPIYWSSKQQELTALSTVEAEYIALSSATRHVLYILHLLEDLKASNIDFDLPKTQVHAKCFEDNAGCLELAKAPKLRPRTKHIAVKFHHFLGFVKTDENPNGILELQWISGDEQQADGFTKPLTPDKFTKLRKLTCGW